MFQFCPKVKNYNPQHLNMPYRKLTMTDPINAKERWKRLLEPFIYSEELFYYHLSLRIILN